MITVTKRDGTREPLDINKFHKVALYACEGLSGVSVYPYNINRLSGGKYYPVIASHWANTNGVLTINQLVVYSFVETIDGAKIIRKPLQISFHSLIKDFCFNSILFCKIPVQQNLLSTNQQYLVFYSFYWY